MTRLLRKLINTTCFYIPRRFYPTNETAFFKGSYDGSGKTTITILNEEKHALMIDSYNKYGFQLNNGVFLIGPIAIFPKTVINWNIDCSKNINEESLSLFTILEPKLDLLIIGYEDMKLSQDIAFIQRIHSLIRKYDIQSEVLPVHKAISTFNFLNSEYRYIAAALIPVQDDTPKLIRLEENKREELEITSSKWKHKYLKKT